jgi:hypothetical protein
MLEVLLNLLVAIAVSTCELLGPVLDRQRRQAGS